MNFIMFFMVIAGIGVLISLIVLIYFIKHREEILTAGRQHVGDSSMKVKEGAITKMENA
jgi:cellobiose-specific phosphotransferase system component IIC